jgi:hypothetical protein
MSKVILREEDFQKLLVKRGFEPHIADELSDYFFNGWHSDQEESLYEILFSIIEICWSEQNKIMKLASEFRDGFEEWLQS